MRVKEKYKRQVKNDEDQDIGKKPTWILNSGFKIQDFEFKIPNSKFQIPNATKKDEICENLLNYLRDQREIKRWVSEDGRVPFAILLFVP